MGVGDSMSTRLASLDKSGVPGTWVPRESLWIVPLGLGTDLVVHAKTIHLSFKYYVFFKKGDANIIRTPMHVFKAKNYFMFSE